MAPGFLASLVVSGFLSLVSIWSLYTFISILALYLFSDLAISGSLSLKQRKWTLWFRVMTAFPCMHFAWALGFYKRVLERRKPGHYWGY